MLEQNQTGSSCVSVWRKKAHGCSKAMFGRADLPAPTEALLCGLECR